MMKVIYCRRLDSAKDRDAIAFIDVELNDHIRIYGLRLLRQPDGAHYIYAPQQAGGRRTATFSKPMAEWLTAMAVEAYEAAYGR